jgi:NADPH2:quinone reductase
MIAVVLREFGPPGNLTATEVPDPVAGPGQVLIEVGYASITFIETQTRSGTGWLKPDLPVIQGNGVGGVVRAVGDGVDPSRVGTRVVSTTGGTGGYAELALAAADDALVVPDALSLRDAVALLADGRTALGLFRAAAPAAGEWVLVEAAGGGVGSLLVQLSVHSGARVMAAAGSEPKRKLAEELGAEVVLDYTDPQWTDAAPARPDVVFDGVGGAVGAAALQLVRDGGRFCVHGAASGSMTRLSDEDKARVTLVGLDLGGPAELRELSRAALDEAAAGRLRPTIGQTFPLADAAAAHAAIEARATLGKTLLLAPGTMG